VARQRLTESLINTSRVKQQVKYEVKVGCVRLFTFLHGRDRTVCCSSAIRERSERARIGTVNDMSQRPVLRAIYAFLVGHKPYKDITLPQFPILNRRASGGAVRRIKSPSPAAFFASHLASFYHAGERPQLQNRGPFCVPNRARVS
jgi:hypothetical protein